MATQLQEMEMVRQKVYNLEQTQIAIKQRYLVIKADLSSWRTVLKAFCRYDDEIARLRHELEVRGGQPSHVGISGLQTHAGVSQPQPPAIGHGPSNLFGGIMANPPGQGNPGLVPPSVEQQQPQAPPPHQMPQPPPTLQQPPYAYQQPSNMNNGNLSFLNRNRDSLLWQQDCHTIELYQSFANLLMLGYNSQQSIASPGPGKGRSNRGPPGPGPATPKQNHSIPYQDSRSPQMGRGSPISQQQLRIPDVGNQLADLDPDQLPPNQKREGPDWYAVFNPRIRRVLDVDLVHNLLHESVVCCVRFSSDGRYVATGCNRSAQIFEVSTGSQVAKLQDDSVDKDGDLYIRSVCFSPDGKYLATGAEDKQIRVRYPLHCSIYRIELLH